MHGRGPNNGLIPRWIECAIDMLRLETPSTPQPHQLHSNGLDEERFYRANRTCFLFQLLQYDAVTLGVIELGDSGRQQTVLGGVGSG